MPLCWDERKMRMDGRGGRNPGLPARATGRAKPARKTQASKKRVSELQLQ